MIELINRARANPIAEAARYGISLTEGSSIDKTISSNPKQPLAPVAALQNAASLHAVDMLMRDYFDHNAKEPSPHGRTPTDRAISAGYGKGVGENIALWPTRGMSRQEIAQETHRILFQSPGHRSNILGEHYNQIGIGMDTGEYSGDIFNGNSFDTTVTVECFGSSGSPLYAITGVVYDDIPNQNSTYDLGEGVGGVTLIAKSLTGARYMTKTGSSGGYALEVESGRYEVYASYENQIERLVSIVDVNGENFKLDVLTNLLSQSIELDTNKDRRISPSDALLVINYLNLDPSEINIQLFPSHLDVDRNGRIEAADAQLIINSLSRHSNAESTGFNSQLEVESAVYNPIESKTIVAECASDLTSIQNSPLEPVIDSNYLVEEFQFQTTDQTRFGTSLVNCVPLIDQIEQGKQYQSTEELSKPQACVTQSVTIDVEGRFSSGCELGSSSDEQLPSVDINFASTDRSITGINSNQNVKTVGMEHQGNEFGVLALYSGSEVDSLMPYGDSTLGTSDYDSYEELVANKTLKHCRFVNDVGRIRHMLELNHMFDNTEALSFHCGWEETLDATFSDLEFLDDLGHNLSSCW